MLYSSNINISLSTETARNRVQTLFLTREFKIFRRDYSVKVSRVLLTVSVTEEKAADNIHLAHTICKASKSVSLSLQILRIQWLHT